MLLGNTEQLEYGVPGSIDSSAFAKLKESHCGETIAIMFNKCTVLFLGQITNCLGNNEINGGIYFNKIIIWGIKAASNNFVFKSPSTMEQVPLFLSSLDKALHTNKNIASLLRATISKEESNIDVLTCLARLCHHKNGMAIVTRLAPNFLRNEKQKKTLKKHFTDLLEKKTCKDAFMSAVLELLQVTVVTE